MREGRSGSGKSCDHDQDQCTYVHNIVAIRYRYVDVIKALTKIYLISDKKDERGESAVKTNILLFNVIF